MSPAASSASPAAPAEMKAASALKVTTTPRPGSRLAVEVAVPAERCQASYDAALAKLSRSVKLPGFRRGKVPRPVLLQQIGPLRIRATALEDLVESVFREALQLESIEALGRPDLSEGFEAVLERFAPGDALTLTLEVDVEPTPRLRTTRGLRAEAEPVVYDPSRVDELLEQSRRQLAALVPVEGRPAAAGDVAHVRFSGTFADSGEVISGGSSDGMDVELEEGRMIPGFVEGILGMTVGETRTVACTFPDSYPQKEAAGRPARFVITLEDLKTRELPALDDVFAQQASDHQTLAELRADLEQRVKEDCERRHRANRREALLSALVEELEVELPETLLQQEVRNLVEQTAGQIARQGMDVKKFFTPDLVRSLMDTSRPEAEQRLRRSLALRALAAAEAIKVEEAALEARLREVRRDLEEQAGVDPARLRLAVEEELLRETLLEWLESHSTITEKGAPTPASGKESEPPERKTTPQPKGAGKEASGDTSAAGAATRPRGKKPGRTED